MSSEIQQTEQPTSLERKTQKIFAGTAEPTSIAIFGSLANSSLISVSDENIAPSADENSSDNEIFTNDPVKIQNEAYEKGWGAAVVSDDSPALEDMNALFYLITRQLAYLFEKGIAEWDPETTYYKGSICAVPKSGKICIAKNSGKLGDPDTDRTNWFEFGSDKVTSIEFINELAKKANATTLAAHTANTNNPHAVTKTQLGLGSVDNTSDLNKPVSIAAAAALQVINQRIDAAELSSNSVDVVGTYADLLAYDTSALTPNDIITVISDGNHGGQYSYYRWNGSAFVFIASDPPPTEANETTKGIATLGSAGGAAKFEDVEVKLSQVCTDGTLSGTGTPLDPLSVLVSSGTLDTTATTAQSPATAEPLAGAVTLHKISKTGAYDDLSNKPTIPAVPALASQSEAQTGTENTKIMTPLRVAQAITALAPSGSGGGAVGVKVTGVTTAGAVTEPTSSGPNSVVIGHNSKMMHYAGGTVVIGANITNYKENGVQIGSGSQVTDGSETVVGYQAYTRYGGQAFGARARAQGRYAVAFGQDAKVESGITNMQGGVAIGNEASVSGIDGIAIGGQATVSAQGAVAIGRSINNTEANTVQIGDETTGKRLKGVATGTQATDAVNLAQMQAAVAAAGGSGGGNTFGPWIPAPSHVGMPGGYLIDGEENTIEVENPPEGIYEFLNISYMGGTNYVRLLHNNLIGPNGQTYYRIVLFNGGAVRLYYRNGYFYTLSHNASTQFQSDGSGSSS
ncbi:hypothetical protein [Ereboglobus luteus]|uniref:Trimeric autotransporter adhesin YadA-like head domain-containing protein n=1 Tax=Ereboglobus luteus TaxID=1796921 RepID=A0A2U8E5W5_9BACT|nr:hypothetical protein [Ereboglobus luteus]AWI10328.1 hypothetical protein CKA38_14640 [Ereboglobus luteus]